MNGVFDFDLMMDHARLNHSSYLNAHPFPHLVMDDVIDRSSAETVYQTFPLPSSEAWYRYDNVFEKKQATNRMEHLHHTTQRVLAEFNSGRFVEFLETLTGIQGLIPDPHFRGGGLHQILPGGKLDIHADFNWHDRLNLDRRINVLLYLNPAWQDEYGGCLELWDPEMQGCQVRIPPVFNRMVVFNTTDRAYHGHPEPLTCPAGMTRKSLALYYYTAGRPDDEQADAHSTLYQRRPSDPLDLRTEELRARRAKGRLT